jgi:signal peptidase II
MIKFSLRSVLNPLHLWTISVLVILDQLTKWIIVKNLPLGQRIYVMPSLNISHIKNRGAAFGVFHDMPSPFRAGFFGLVTLVCFYLLLYWLSTTPREDRWQRFSLAMILGGAIGNVIDRVLYGEVTDFIDFYYGNWHFPTFNVADSAITVGVILIFIKMIPWPKQNQKIKSQRR